MFMFAIIESHKALIITILLSSIVVLLAFTVHIKKKNAFDAETYYEVIPEEELIKEQEELAELIKSLDEVMNSNRAFNETEKNTDEVDDEFLNTMERIRNRALNDPNDEEISERSNTTIVENENSAAFEDINDLIETRSEKKRAEAASTTNEKNKRSSVSYSLVNRTHEYLPPPIYLCEQGGKIVITIHVDGNGDVVDASYNNSSTSSNGCLLDHALEYAKASKFNTNGANSTQIGTITFLFKGKS
jgi:hypothetical protein